MSLLPEDAGYLEHVQAYFLAFRGDGVSLSPNDAELLAGWKARGVPYPVVCRGIRRAAESLLYNNGAGTRLRTLRSCRMAVERELRCWEGAPAPAVGRDSTSAQAPAEPAPSAESFAAKRLKKARSALRKALAETALDAAKAAIQAAQAIVSMELDGPRQVSALVARADDALCLVYLRRLPAAPRRALMKEARDGAGPRPAGASLRARKDALRAHRVALARGHGQLPALS